ncbi:MAG TPA: phosphate regulon sensor histidine kinase PhoR [Thiobacillaceae bacterium]|nr:phosphate regulon sensor histidine kinase PhoR [Thiobacillaceae bacterium]
MSYWWRPLLLLAGLILIGGLFWLAGRPLAGLGIVTAGLALQLAHHLRQLRRLDAWLAAPQTAPPSSDGLWGDVLYRLHKHLRAGRAANQHATANLEQMLHAARSLPDGVVILDDANRITWVNAAAGRHLGLSAEHDLGQFVLYLVRGARFGAWLTDPPGAPMTMPAVTARDTTLSLQMVPLPHGSKMLLTHDISDLVRVDAMRRDFVANVSHELRTPITVIVGFLEAFADMDMPDPKLLKNHLGLMREQTERIRRLVDDLLTLARLESDMELKEDVVDLPALALALLHEAKTLSGDRHQVSLEPSCAARLRGSQQEIHSALGNLVSNAVRYTPAGGQITLSWAATAEGGAAFSVSDTGEGIEPENIPRLTERFYRVDKGRSRATGGTGLGLAIVKHVLARHQARLKVESTVGKGSTFSAVFPAERVISPEKPAEADRSAGQAAA